MLFLTTEGNIDRFFGVAFCQFNYKVQRRHTCFIGQHQNGYNGIDIGVFKDRLHSFPITVFHTPHSGTRPDIHRVAHPDKGGTDLLKTLARFLLQIRNPQVKMPAAQVGHADEHGP